MNINKYIETREQVKQTAESLFRTSVDNFCKAAYRKQNSLNNSQNNDSDNELNGSNLSNNL